MNEISASASRPAAGGPAHAAAARMTGRGGKWLGVVAVIALAALSLAAWQAYSNRQEIDGLRQELAKRLADVDVQNKAGRIAGDQLREATREASVKIGVLEGKLAESQNQQIALEALYQDLSRNRDEWAFAEIEQTLLVASQQLQLAGNVRAALIALQAADTRLQHMNRPQLLALRKAINEDITRLKAAPFVDTAGLSVRIDTLIAAADKLPLAAETRPPGEAASAPAATTAQGDGKWSRFWREVWTDLRQLVRVQRIESVEVPLLAPTQAYFLRENLKLRLLTARIALLTRDQATFRGDLKAAQDWLARYFDARDKAVVVASTALAALQKSDVSIELPDLSVTLAALRAVSPAGVRGK
ncbi:MAG TPA: uroporphyrinogen-III C-methyltransferase [Burkholderiales bacterium]|nr:uroporphyrinogen-III C-methyltransferase [Burkholderiales bacterium]